MSKQNLNIDIKLAGVSVLNDLTNQLSPAFLLKSGDCLYLIIDFEDVTKIRAEILTLIVALVNFLREEVALSGIVKNLGKAKSDAVKYASRMNFFDLIGLEFEEEFNRHNSSGKFIEITKFDKDNAVELCNDLVAILNKDKVNQEMLAVLDYCLWELIDNSLRHALPDESVDSGSGYLSCQYFEFQKEIRLIIVDNGQGIHQALTKYPNSPYSHFSEAEAIEKCVENGVTNGTGMGFGLWATKELIRLNQGEMIIHSGAHMLQCNQQKTIDNTANWQGTITYLRINSDIAVNEENIFGSDYNLSDNFREKLSVREEVIKSLW